MEGRAVKLFRENPEKFKTRRQASKYLNGFGTVWKTEKGIELTEPKRGKTTDPNNKRLGQPEDKAWEKL